MTNRRDFLKSACAAAAACGLPARVWGAAGMIGKPDLVIGLLSDIHIKLFPKSDPVAATRLFRHALEYFRDRHVDGVLISGDLAHMGLESELKAIADAWFAVFPGGKLPDGSPVANLMHYGDHDAETRFYTEQLKESFRNAGVALPRSLSEGELRKECWEKFFGEAWSPVRHVRVKGYDFVLSNFMREGGRSAPENLDALLKAMKLDPAKPFFYSQHRYIGGTYLPHEEMWGGDNGVARRVLARYPNCLAFQGHTHYMLNDERNVWIGDFVSMNNGSLDEAYVGRMRENGIDISWYENDYMRDSQMPAISYRTGHGGSVMTLKDDIVVIERRDFGADMPIGPDIVFSMDVQLRPKHVDAARKAASVAPEFAPGAEGKVAQGEGLDRRKRRTEQVTVSFPTVNAQGGRPRAHEYFVRAEKPDGTLLKEKRVYSPGINLPEAKDAPVTTCVFAKRELAGAESVLFAVRPANCWGVCGRPLQISSSISQARASTRDGVLRRLREVAASPAYYWAWTYPWQSNKMPTPDFRHVVERDGRFLPKPTDEVRLECEYQKYTSGRRALINYSDLALMVGTFGPDRAYQVNRAGHTASIKRQWKEFGGLQVFSWHMDHPYCTSDFNARPYRYKSEGANRNVVRQILDGTGGPCGTDTVLARGARKPFRNPREWFLASLKDVADFFNGLVDEETGRKIPVVLRYPHECDGNWFWWGRTWCTTDEFRRLCRMEADYLREKCGNDQIIFAYTPDRTWHELGNEGDAGNTFLAYYPGDKYVDIIGLDDYSIGNGSDDDVERNLAETVRKLRLMTKFAGERGKIVCISEAGGDKKRDDFWQYLHRAATAEGVKVAFADTWAWTFGCLPTTPASEADEKAFAARPEVLLESSGKGFR